MRRKTMRDVSVATGLSTYTVSRALSGADGVSAESRAHVLKVAREIGYIPNRAAQELRRANRDSVAVITASTSNSYYLDLMEGIHHALRSTGRAVIVGDIAIDGVYSAELEDQLVRRLIESRTAGVIATLTLRPENLKLLDQWDVPVVFVDSDPPEGAGHYPSVTTDNYAASLTVGDHIASHGYGNWLLLMYPDKWSTRFERERGIRDAAARHAADLTVIECENNDLAAQEAFARHLEEAARLPDVLIAGNNPLLLGALKLCREKAIRIPDDMAVVSFDDFAWAPLMDPPLTVLDEDSKSIGSRAAATLTAIIEQQIESEKRSQSTKPDYKPEYRQQMPARLVVRRSCGCTSETREKN